MFANDCETLDKNKANGPLKPAPDLAIDVLIIDHHTRKITQQGAACAEEVVQRVPRETAPLFERGVSSAPVRPALASAKLQQQK